MTIATETQRFTSEQEIFDHVAAHLLTQGEKARADGGCAYRGWDGKACAIGCLIPDAAYVPEMEEALLAAALRDRSSLDATLMPRRHAALLAVLDGLDLTRFGDLLTRLQSVHDDIAIRRWAEELREVAAEFHLTVPDCLKEKKK